MRAALYRLYASNKHVSHGLILLALLGLALGIRIATPSCFHLPGNDIPEHIAYSMRLDFPDPARSFFRTTLDRLLSSNHGYTQAAGIYLLYKTTFDWLSAPINPQSLALVHSLVGVASLVAFFAFVRRQTSFHDAIIITACFALIPVHIGISILGDCVVNHQVQIRQAGFPHMGNRR